MSDAITEPPVGVPRRSLDRARLSRVLDSVPNGGVGLIVAPAGFGKTTLLAQWASEAVGRRCCRIEAHDRLNDPDRLRTLLEGCFAPGAARQSEQTDATASDGRGAGEGVDSPVDLVIDDLHVITNEGSLTLLADVVANLAAPDRVVLASREEPVLPLHRQRVAGRLVELRQADLAFSSSEVAELVSSVSGKVVSGEQAEALRARCDGWPAGIQLAAVSLQTAPDVDAFVASFAGSLRVVFEYLTAEVLAQQPDELREFLVATSVLDEFGSAACDAVTGRTDSRSLLAELERRSVFLVRTDELGERFRYHHLFGDMLRHMLRATDPEAHRRYRERAARWYRAAGDLGAAIDQLVALGDTQDAFELIVVHGRRWWEQGDAVRLGRWMDAIAAAPDHPAVVDLARLMAQIAANEWPAGIETSRTLSRRDDLTADEEGAAAAYHAGLGHFDIPASEVVEAATEALDAIPRMDGKLDVFGLTDPGSLEQVAWTLLGLAEFHLGELSSAIAHLERVAASSPARYPLYEAHSLASLALIRAWSGQLRDAERLANAASSLAQELGRSDHQAVDDARLATALIAYERDEVVDAQVLLHDARLWAERRRRTANLEVVDLLEARIVARTEGVQAGLDAVQGSQWATWLRPSLAAGRANLEARLWLQAGDPAAAERALGAWSTSTFTLPARVELALGRDEVDLAGSLVAGWVPETVDVRGNVEQMAWRAVVLDAAGEQAQARQVAIEAAEQAAVHGMRRVVLEVPRVLRLMSATSGGHAWPSEHSGAAGVAVGAPLVARVEVLSARELAILPYLPTRLSNAELARELHVSVNTIKSHLRSIYRKLGVTDRDGAIAAATEVGLL